MSNNIPKYKNVGRLKNALISNASFNQISEFVENYAVLKSSVNETALANFRNSLMDSAIKNISKDVVEFLISEKALCNYATCIYDCKYDKIEEVYNYINEMIEKHGSFTMNTIHLHKGMVIRRLIDPAKVFANKDRLAYTIDLIRKGFISSQEVREISNELYKNEKYKSHFTMMNRDLLLTELGI